jgi:hypothetical protein
MATGCHPTACGEQRTTHALGWFQAVTLERGDAGVCELDDGYVGVKVMGRRLARVHRSRLVAPVDN